VIFSILYSNVKSDRREVLTTRTYGGVAAGLALTGQSRRADSARLVTIA